LTEGKEAGCEAGCAFAFGAATGRTPSCPPLVDNFLQASRVFEHEPSNLQFIAAAMSATRASLFQPAEADAKVCLSSRRLLRLGWPRLA
jgi:hypothetical protein